MFIKTVSTTTGINPIKFDETGGVFYWILNTGLSTIYASTKSAFTAGDDGVVSLGPKESRRLETNNDTIYILGAGQVEIHNQRDGICSFKQAPTSSGSGGGGTVDAYSKTESDAKYAQKTDIPSSLPANGGNADYAAVAHDTQLFNGKPSDNYVQFRGVIQVDDMSAVPADVYEYANDPTYKVAYEVAVSPLVSEFMGLPHIWWLIKYYAYGYGNGFSCQTAFPVGFGGTPYIRYSQEGVWSDWKEISTTPIKKMTFPSVAINSDGAGNLFSADFGAPIVIACTSRVDTQCTPFYYRDGNLWRLLAKDASTLGPIPAGSYSVDVWYI